MASKFNPGEEVFVVGHGYGKVITFIRRGRSLRYFVRLEEGTEAEFGASELRTS